MTDATLSSMSSRHRPRIVVFVASSETVDVGPLSHKVDLHLTNAWTDVQIGNPTYEAVVLIANHRALRDLAPHVVSLQRSMPATPIILVTDPHPESWRRLSGVTFTEILWMEELPTTLWPAIRRALQDTGLNTLHKRAVQAT